MKEQEHNQLYCELSTLIHTAIQEAYPGQTLEKSVIYKSLGPTPKVEMGQIAFPCFSLSKSFKQSPNLIAQSLHEKVEKSSAIIKSLVVGPYLNFFISHEYLGQNIITRILSEEFFNDSIFITPPSSMIEYSQPNTHKELHVGHMRNLCLGNSIVEILKYTKHKVYSVTYPGDVGTHVAKCLWYLNYHNKKEAPITRKGAWLGEMYSKANNLLEDQKGTDKEEFNRTELTEILKQLESQKGEYFHRWKETREWSISLMEELYSWANISFDRWYWESELDSSSLNMAKKYYEKGIFTKSENAIGMDLSEDKLGFCMAIKSDGTGLYATKDIELAQRKFEEYDIKNNLYLVDKRQSHHFKQVFKVLEKINFKNAKNCHHLEYDFVELPDGAMSSRKGNIIPIMTLIEQMESTIKSEYLDKYTNEWSVKQIEDTAKIIANGAIKYGMLRMDNSRKIVFEMSDWLKLDGETGPYLQYVYARINSLEKKLDIEIGLEEQNWKLLNDPSELNVMIKLSLFNSVTALSATQYRPSVICSYLYELGKLFNNFYAKCPIKNSGDAELSSARLALALAVGKTMKSGLKLLGIQAPEQM